MINNNNNLKWLKLTVFLHLNAGRVVHHLEEPVHVEDQRVQVLAAVGILMLRYYLSQNSKLYFYDDEVTGVIIEFIP